MLDFFWIFTKGGLVLWSFQIIEIHGNPINNLIQSILLEERSGKTSFIVDQYLMKWTFANDLGLVFVAAHQKALSLPYVEDLLETVKKNFCDKVAPTVLRDFHKMQSIHYDPIFHQINSTFESTEEAPKAQRTFQDSKKSKAGDDVSEKSKKKKAATAAISTAAAQEGEEEGGGVTSEDAADETPSSPSAPLSPDQVAAKMKELRERGKKKVVSTPASPESPQPEEKKKKVMAESKSGKLTKEQLASLDYSSGSSTEFKVPENLIDAEELQRIKKNGGTFQIGDIEYKQKDAAKDTSTMGRLTSFFKGLTGQKTLDKEDLEEPLAKMKDLLVTKNVAVEIANSLTDSVLQSLIGKTISSFTGVTSILRESMEGALQRILTPKKSTDLLREIMTSKEQGKPFSVVFCGVNGVGKSTNLSKICFWLLQNKLSVLIAACDTFRSGAVEQLNVHVRNLKALTTDSNTKIELFQKGYGKDAAAIAKEAITYAKPNNFDVVLVDTAGRMQDNEPLMRALAKLVKINNPNKVFFVGEALVGNDGVDQLVKFNQALKDLSDLADPRQIDGIVLTKFDTIDDKVGAALSMTYTTGQPIVFVGTGQTYTDLKKLNVKAVVDSLLS